MIRVAIFASGEGTNAARLMDAFSAHPVIRVAALYSNNPEAGALTQAKQRSVASRVFNRDELRNGAVLTCLRDDDIHWLVLAGFLWLIPADILKAYPGRIINIHPALLPKFGGKNMYGAYVHKAVKMAGEKRSGITVHFVDERYDHGETIEQVVCELDPADDVAAIESKVRALEKEHFPGIVERVIVSADGARPGKEG